MRFFVKFVLLIAVVIGFLFNVNTIYYNNGFKPTTSVDNLQINDFISSVSFLKSIKYAEFIPGENTTDVYIETEEVVYCGYVNNGTEFNAIKSSLALVGIDLVQKTTIPNWSFIMFAVLIIFFPTKWMRRKNKLSDEDLEKIQEIVNQENE